MLGGLDGLMPQGLIDNLDGLVLIFQRHGKAVTGSIYCNVLLTLRELQLLGNLLQGGIEALTDFGYVHIQSLGRHFNAYDGQGIVFKQNRILGKLIQFPLYVGGNLN